MQYGVQNDSERILIERQDAQGTAGREGHREKGRADREKVRETVEGKCCALSKQLSS